MLNVLIVEDEPEAHRLLAMLVGLRGHRTVSAFGGREALALIASDPPDVVLLDLMLPDLNGREVCRSLKGRKETAAIPVVVVSAALAVDNRLRCFALGADDFVPKPYTPDAIFEALDDAARLARRGDPEAAEGAFDVVAGDDGESLRDLARTLNLLAARTGLAPDASARIGRAFRARIERADRDQAGRGRLVVATLRHRAFADRVEFDWIDRAGAGLPDPPDDTAFDETHIAGDGTAVTWVVRFPESPSPPA